MEECPSWKAGSYSVGKVISAFYGNRHFIPTSTRAATDLYLSYMNLIHNSPLYSSKINLKLPSHLFLVLPSGLSPSGLRTKILFAFLISPMRVTDKSQVTFLDFITLIRFGEAYKL